jgi:hypothetical protein
MTRFLDHTRLLATYESHGGEHCFVRFGLRTVSEELPGFASAVRPKELVEAVFVPAESAAVAELVVRAAGPYACLAQTLEGRGIPWRLPSGVHAPAAVPLRHLEPVEDLDEVAESA